MMLWLSNGRPGPALRLHQAQTGRTGPAAQEAPAPAGIIKHNREHESCYMMVWLSSGRPVPALRLRLAQTGRTVPEAQQGPAPACSQTKPVDLKRRGGRKESRQA
jgi:hypothetical protein